jgi:hypothetical protein
VALIEPPLEVVRQFQNQAGKLLRLLVAHGYERYHPRSLRLSRPSRGELQRVSEVEPAELQRRDLRDDKIASLDRFPEDRCWCPVVPRACLSGAGRRGRLYRTRIPAFLKAPGVLWATAGRELLPRAPRPPQTFFLRRETPSRTSERSPRGPRCTPSNAEGADHSGRVRTPGEPSQHCDESVSAAAPARRGWRRSGTAPRTRPRGESRHSARGRLPLQRILVFGGMHT